jgi:hypothetical protein
MRCVSVSLSDIILTIRYIYIYVAYDYDLRIHHVGGSHLERRGSRCHMARQTKVTGGAVFYNYFQ